MLFDTKHGTICTKFVWNYGVGYIFSCVERSPFNFPAWVHVFWYETCYYWPKTLSETMISAIFFVLVWFSLEWFGFDFAPIISLRSLFNFPAWVHSFWYPTCHYWPISSKNHSFSYTLFCFVLLWFSWFRFVNYHSQNRPESLRDTNVWS